MDPEDFNPDDDDAIEAAQRAADGEDADADAGNDQPSGEGDAGTTEGQEQQADPEAAAAAVVDAAAAAQSAAEAQATAGAAEAAEKVQGVASKDGSRVLPYSALQAERRAARKANADRDRAQQRAQELQQEIEDLKAGKTRPSDDLTEEDLAELEANFPDQAKKVRAVIARQQAEAARTTTSPAEPDEEEGDSPIQEAIDATPLLFEWQHSDAEKFGRAVEIDAVLMKSPKWIGKPTADRFAHVARMVAEEYDLEVPETRATPAPTPPAKPAPAAKAAADAAKRPPPNTLSDFKGGALPDHGSVNYEKMTPQTMLGRFTEMTDAELDAHLARLG